MPICFKWQGAPRQEILNRTWNVSSRTRTRWIDRLDQATNAIICFDLVEGTVELRMMSSVDGIAYCAGVQIQVLDYNELYNSISSSSNPLS